ncbi:MAG: DUF427 domain-containing protein [Deltaproteobacteria bacterium]|nr:DUF427 domain-containing protein [Deltaproteobacteria bacterium]
MKHRRIEPGPGQESVWDYPRPPAVQRTDKHVEVFFNNILIADSTDAKRVLETSSPPVFYIPPRDIEMKYLVKSGRTTYCEWKGVASYYSVEVHDKRSENAAWCYPDPAPGYESIKDYFAFYPRLMDACYVDGELVKPQPGEFYGGWVTGDIVGPFKGEPGTEGW